MTRRPLDGARRVTGDTASHAAYNVGPATDYGADSGEPIRAPFGGWVTRWWSTTGGYSVAITTSWVKFTVQHLSAYAGKSAGQVNEGDIIGHVGNTGTATTGPHVHCWILLIESGARISFEDYLKGAGWTNTAADGGRVPSPYNTKPAGGGLTPFPETELESDMRSIKHETTGEHALVGEFTFTLMNAGFANPEAKVWNPNGVHILVSDAEWKNIEYLAAQNAKRLATTATGVAPVIDYVKLAALIKVPTASENGAAARAAIVKS